MWGTMSSLRQFLAEGRLRRQTSNAVEIKNLLLVAERDLADARVEGVTADRRFATAYNAALQLATAALRAEGYRTSGTGHHFTTLAVLTDILGAEMQSTADYLNACRAKRNTVDYNGIGVANERDVRELIEEAEILKTAMHAWLLRVHPGLIDEGGR